jgi:hypothetical protein
MSVESYLGVFRPLIMKSAVVWSVRPCCFREIDVSVEYIAKRAEAGDVPPKRPVVSELGSAANASRRMWQPRLQEQTSNRERERSSHGPMMDQALVRSSARALNRRPRAPDVTALDPSLVAAHGICYIHIPISRGDQLIGAMLPSLWISTIEYAWSWALLEKSPVVQLRRNFPAL